MGKKGDTLTNSSTQAAEDLQRRLGNLGEITTKKMFGGYGVFESGVMFALVDSGGGVYLKADDSNRGRFEEAGSKKHGRMPYYKIPEDVLGNDSDIVEWAQASIIVAKKAK